MPHKMSLPKFRVFARVTPLFVCVLMTLALTACNLTTQEDELEPTATTSAQVGGKPTVTINSPASGTSVTVNTPVLISVSATDQVGVTRVQLLENDNIIISKGSETPQTAFNAVLDYTPKTVGDVTLKVIAYRSTIVSDPQQIQLKVISATSPTATPNPNAGGDSGGVVGLPTLDPFDPTCRVRTNVALNLRTGAGTNFDKITTLGAGTIVPITVRLSDNSWFKVRYGTTEGWVSGSAEFSTIFGNCSIVPVPTSSTLPTATPTITLTPNPSVTPTATIMPLPADLVVTNLSGQSQVAIPVGQDSIEVEFSFTIANTGEDKSGQTRSSLRIVGQGDTVYIPTGNLRRGENVFLQAKLRFTAAGTYTVEVKADADNSTAEISEVNNTAVLSVTVIKN